MTEKRYQVVASARGTVIARAAPSAEAAVDGGVDDAVRPLPAEHGGGLPARHAGRQGGGLRGLAGGVGAGDDVRELQERVPRIGGLGLEHVDAGAGDPAVLEGAGEGGLVDDAAAAAVDEVGGPLHRPELALAHEVTGLGVQGDLDGDPVRFPEESVKIVHQPDAELARDVLLDVGIVGDHAEAERLEAPRQRLADLAQAHQSRRLAVQRRDRPAGRPVPHALSHRPVVRDELPVEREEHRRRVVGDLEVAHPRGVGDQDARARGGVHVHRVVPVAESADGLRPVHGRDHLGVHLEEADHHDVGAPDGLERVRAGPALDGHGLDVEPVEGGGQNSKG